MLYLRRAVRRIKGWFWSLWYAITAPFLWARFRYQMRGTGLSERYVWKAFTYLAGLDMRDPMHADLDGRHLEIFGAGFYLELQDRANGFHATLQQTAPRRLVIQLWRPTKRAVTIDGFKGDTHWWEVYRTGRRVDVDGLTEVHNVLRELYGDGTMPPEQEEQHAV